MRIFINLPTWLGDAIMASPAIKAIYDAYPSASFVLYGTYSSTVLFKNMKNTLLIEEVKHKRYSNMFKARKKLASFDLAISFRSAVSSKILLGILKTKHKFYFNKYAFKNLHQTLQYIYFVKESLGITLNSSKLFIPIKPKTKKKIFAIAPGAKYGSAKRWDASYFASTAAHFAKEYKIVLFGSKDEEDICKDIEKLLAKDDIKAKNLCSKTSIPMLIKWLSGASLLLTNDSGAMHAGAVYKTPTVAVFGPTSWDKTSPWENQNSRLIHLDLLCMPCMQRTCPLHHHKCMKDLKPKRVIEACEEFLN